LDFRAQPRRSVIAWSALRWSSCLRVSNKIEFSYLNWNLMVPKLRLLTLAFDGNSRKTRTMSLLVRSDDGLVTTLSRQNFQDLDTKTLVEEESQYICPRKQE
jgi:hypothetical protein